MSLLSDLLSKVKHFEPKRGIPPGLINMVSTLKKRESNKRRLAIVMILALITVGAGFITVYLVEIYLKGGTRQSELQKGMTEQRKQQVQPSQAVLNEKPHQEPLTEEQKRMGETVKARQPEKKSEEKDIQEKKRGMVEPQKKSPLKKPVQEVIQDSKFKNSDEPEKTPRIEKPKPDTSEKDLYLYMAKNYEAKGDYPNALVSYKKVLDIEPKNYRVMNNIASILIRLNSYNEARIYSQMAIDVRNDYVPGLINMGIVLAKLGEAQEAENCLLKALTLEPNNRDAILNIAIFYEKEGSYDKAREYYLRLKQLGDQQGSLGLERIKTVTSNK